MIRRGFWLTAGAVTGIYGYRRVSAIGRRLSASLNPAGPGLGTPSGSRVSLAQGARLAQGVGMAQGARLAYRGRRGTIRLARETYRFSRDVREGMELYTARHSAPAGSTLSTDHDISLSTDHDIRPEDGH